jgi:hypothetical protein
MASGFSVSDRRRVVVAGDAVEVRPELTSEQLVQTSPEPEQFKTWTCPTHGQERDYNEPGIPADKRRCIQMIAAGVDTLAVNGNWTWGEIMARAVAFDAIPDLTTYDGLELRQQYGMGLLGKLIGYGKQPPFRRHSPDDPPPRGMSRHDGSPSAEPIRRHE